MNNLIVVGILILLVVISSYFIIENKGTAGLSSEVKDNVFVITSSVNLSNQQLTKVPEDVFNKTNLEELNVSGNRLTGSLQAEVGHLKNLRVLNLSNNAFTGVPAEVGQLENLETLDLSNNQLTGLPNEIGNLQNLKVLNISGNNYSEQDLEQIEKLLPATTQIIK